MTGLKRGKSPLLAVFLGILLCCGCGGRKGTVRGPGPPDVPTGPRVAVAPMENRSNDLNASEIIRGAFVEQIGIQGWNVVPTAESDRQLRENLGISYGGQLNATTPDEVCRALGVEGIFYGEVQEWNKTTTGIYNTVSVVAGFRLYRKDGALAWEGGDRQYKRNMPGGGGRDLGAEIVAHAIMNLLMNPMTPYGKAVGRNAASKLPHDALHMPITGSSGEKSNIRAGTPGASREGQPPEPADNPRDTGGKK